MRLISLFFIASTSCLILASTVMGNPVAMYNFIPICVWLVILLLPFSQRVGLALHGCGSVTFIVLYFLSIILGLFVTVTYIFAFS